MNKDDQAQWHFLFSLFFVGVAGVLYAILLETVPVPRKIPLFEALLIALATFRLTRLFVYDTITQFVRDWFLDVRMVEGKSEAVREKPASGPRRTIATLLGCPWCFAVWPALVLSFFYFYTPHAWFFILVLALAGVASIFQVVANLIGWSAEFKKCAVTGVQGGGQHSGTCG